MSFEANAAASRTNERINDFIVSSEVISVVLLGTVDNTTYSDDELGARETTRYKSNRSNCPPRGGQNFG